MLCLEVYLTNDQKDIKSVHCRDKVSWIRKYDDAHKSVTFFDLKIRKIYI